MPSADFDDYDDPRDRGLSQSVDEAALRRARELERQTAKDRAEKTHAAQVEADRARLTYKDLQAKFSEFDFDLGDKPHEFDPYGAPAALVKLRSLCPHMSNSEFEEAVRGIGEPR